MGMVKRTFEMDETEGEEDMPEELNEDGDFIICSPDVEELRSIMQEIEGSMPEVAARIREVLNSLVEI